MHFDEISDEEWLLLAPILADPPIAHRQRGRLRAQVRVVANAVLRVLTTGESWAMLPSHYPSAPTCRHRFEAWRSSGALARIVRILSNAGRTFRCGSQFILQRRDASSRGIVRQIRDDGFRRVLWSDQASWQTSRETWQSPHVADTFRHIAQRLPNTVNAAAPVPMPERTETHAPVTTLHAIHRLSSPPADLVPEENSEPGDDAGSNSEPFRQKQRSG